MKTTRKFMLMAFGNVVIAAAVFLPIFLVAGRVTTTTRGFRFPERSIADEAGGAVMLYLGLTIPVGVGVLAYTLALSPFIKARNLRKIQIAAVALAPLVPLAPLTLRVLGGSVFSGLPGATVLAALAYGLAVAIRLDQLWARRNFDIEPTGV